MTTNDVTLLQTKIENSINSLTSIDKKRRLQSLQNLKSELSLISDNKDLLKKLIHTHYGSILIFLNDKAEACREETISIIKDIVEKFVWFIPDPVKSVGAGDELVQIVGSNSKAAVPIDNSKDTKSSLDEEDKSFSVEFTNQVLHIVKQKFTTDNSSEPSEEVRLHLLHLLQQLLPKCNSSILSTIFSPFLSILQTSLTDPYPDIKVISAHLVSSLARGNAYLFHQSGESLIPPLVSNMTHRHSKVRIATVQAVGDAVQYGNNKTLPEVTGPLAERLFDQHPAVRSAVLDVTTGWLLNLHDRYSYFARLIPIMLTCLCDELPSIQVKALESWQRVGEQYYEENKSDARLKDKMDFLSQELDHYPAGVPRPNLGCRVLVQREMSKFLPALHNEIFHWQPHVRVKSAQLLCSLAQHEEHNIVQHIPSVLTLMCRACADEETAVRDNVERAAEMIGYFVRPQVYCGLILPGPEDSFSLGQVTVLAAILKGGRVEELSGEGEKIAEFLSQPHVCQSREIAYQQRLLSIASSLLTCSSPLLTRDSRATQSLFTLLLTVQALGSRADAHLGSLAERAGFDSLSDMFRTLSTQVLACCARDARDWCVASPWRCVLETLLCYTGVGGSLSSAHIDTTISIFTQVVQPEKDATLILKMLLLLCYCLDDPESALSSVINLGPVLDRIIKDVLTVHLVWRAGKSQEALRTAAVAALRSCLSRMSTGDDKRVSSSEDKTESSSEDNMVPSNGHGEILSCLDKMTLSPPVDKMTLSPPVDKMTLSPPVDKMTLSPPVDNKNSTKDSDLVTMPHSDSSSHSMSPGETHYTMPSATIETLLPLLMGTLEDSAVRTRLYSQDCVSLLLSRHGLKNILGSDGFNKLYQVVLKRLDDESDEVRKNALGFLTTLLLQGVPQELEPLSEGCLGLVYRTLLVHLDDQNADFQQLVLGSLQKLGKLNQEVLLRYIRVENFRDKDLAQSLYNHFSDK